VLRIVRATARFLCVRYGKPLWTCRVTYNALYNNYNALWVTRYVHNGFPYAERSSRSRINATSMVAGAKSRDLQLMQLIGRVN